MKKYKNKSHSRLSSYSTWLKCTAALTLISRSQAITAYDTSMMDVQGESWTDFLANSQQPVYTGHPYDTHSQWQQLSDSIDSYPSISQPYTNGLTQSHTSMNGIQTVLGEQIKRLIGQQIENSLADALTGLEHQTNAIPSDHLAVNLNPQHEMLYLANTPLESDMQSHEIETMANNLFTAIYPYGYSKYKAFFKKITIAVTGDDGVAEGEISFSIEDDKINSQVTLIRSESQEFIKFKSTNFSWQNKQAIQESFKAVLRMGYTNNQYKNLFHLLLEKSNVNVSETVYDGEKNAQALLKWAIPETPLTPTQQRLINQTMIPSSRRHDSDIMKHWYAKSLQLIRHLLGPYLDSKNSPDYFWGKLYTPLMTYNNKADQVYVTSVLNAKMMLTEDEYKETIHSIISREQEQHLANTLQFYLGDSLSQRIFENNQIFNVRFIIRFIGLIQNFIVSINVDTVTALHLLLTIRHQIVNVARQTPLPVPANIQIKLEKTLSTLIEQISNLGKHIRIDEKDFYTPDSALRLAYLLNQHPQLASGYQNKIISSSNQMKTTAFKNLFTRFPAGLHMQRDNAWIRYYQIFEKHFAGMRTKETMGEMIDQSLQLPSGIKFREVVNNMGGLNQRSFRREENWHRKFAKFNVWSRPEDEEEQTSFILAVLEAHKMFRTQIMLSNNIKAVQEGLFTGLVIIPIVLRIHDYFISRGIKKDTLEKWNNLSVKLLAHNKQKIIKKARDTQQEIQAKKALQEKRQAQLDATLKRNAILEEEKKRKATEKRENVIKAHQHILGFCESLSITANHERYTLGRSNAHTSIINQHWFNNNEIQFLIPEKFKITEKIKARRKKPSLQTNLPESAQDIQRLLDTIDKKLTMLTNTPVKNEDTDQKFSELRSVISELFKQSHNKNPRL